MQYAPLVVFVYNRPDHVRNCFSSLIKANGAKNTDLYIFSDGPKQGSECKVAEVREYINQIASKEYFRDVTIVESDSNKGLADSVICGVTFVIEKYGKCIVLEDDNIVRQDFLLFMNNALDYYQDNKRIWSVAGFSVVQPSLCKNDVYFLGRICSYAWGIWKDRWDRVDWEIKDYKKFRFDFNKRKLFNDYGTDRSNMLDRQMLGEINSWAIRFDYAAFKNRMLTVYPKETRVKNNGMDGSGTHFNKKTNRYDVKLLNTVAMKYSFDNQICVDEEIKKDFCSHCGLRRRARLKRIFFREISFIRRRIKRIYRSWR